jgi:Flp pilus assembly protein TadD
VTSAAAALFVAALAAAGPDPLAEAEKLLEARDYRGAELVLRELLRHDPSNARAHGNLALALLSRKKLAEAVDEGRLAAAFAPSMPEARYIYGMTLRAAGRPLEAARELERADTLKPGQVGVVAALAEAYAAAGDERAAPAYEKLILLAPSDPAAPAGLAEYLWSTGRIERGNAAAAKALERFPDSADLHRAFGRALFDQENFANAARELGRSLELGAGDPGTYLLWSNALWRSGDTAAATRAFDAGLARDPTSAALLQDAGRFSLSIGDHEGALARLSEAARLKPKDASVQLDLGRAREAAGRKTEAEAAYRLAVALSPQLGSPHYALGTLLVRTGRREEGQRELAAYQSLYERAARLSEEQNVRAAELALAWSELNTGSAAAALVRFSSMPETPDVLLGRAAALSRLRRHAEAVRVLERARQLSPENARIQTMLAAERAREGS